MSLLVRALAALLIESGHAKSGAKAMNETKTDSALNEGQGTFPLPLPRLTCNADDSGRA